MVKFIKATCPSCGGDLQLPDGLAKAFCPYCGATVILEWEGRPGPGPTAESYLQLGGAAMQARNFKEAYEYCSKALELNPNMVPAWFGKALALLENQPIEGLVGGALALYPEERQMVRTYLEKVLSLDPNHVLALRSLGALWNHDELLEKAASLDPSERPRIARTLLSMGGNVRVEDAGRIDSLDWSQCWSSDLLAARFEAAYRIDPNTKNDVNMAKEMFLRAFDVEYKKQPFLELLGLSPHAVLVVARQDLVDRAIELEPALGSIVDVVLKIKFFYEKRGGYIEWHLGGPLSKLQEVIFGSR